MKNEKEWDKRNNKKENNKNIYKEKKRMIRSPLEQFKIKEWIGGINNNVIIGIIGIMIIILITKREERLGETRKGLIWERIYETIRGLIKKELKEKGEKEIYIIMSILIFIILNNMISMIPYSYSMTSQIIGIISISNWIWISNIIKGIKEKGKRYVEIWLPMGTPIGLIPLIIIIEIISYISRSISLGLRLSSNIISGHILMSILSELLYKIIKWNKLLIIPSMIMIIIILLELSIGIIQGYVFIILMISYMKDSIGKH